MDLQARKDMIRKVHEQYASKYGLHRETQDYLLKFQEETGEFIKEFMIRQKKARPEKIKEESVMKYNMMREFSDMLGHLFLLAKVLDIDPEEALREKWLKHLEK